MELAKIYTYTTPKFEVYSFTRSNNISYGMGLKFKNLATGSFWGILSSIKCKMKVVSFKVHNISISVYFSSHIRPSSHISTDFTRCSFLYEDLPFGTPYEFSKALLTFFKSRLKTFLINLAFSHPRPLPASL